MGRKEKANTIYVNTNWLFIGLVIRLMEQEKMGITTSGLVLKMLSHLMKILALLLFVNYHIACMLIYIQLTFLFSFWGVWCLLIVTYVNPQELQMIYDAASF